MRERERETTKKKTGKFGTNCLFKTNWNENLENVDKHNAKIHMT